MSYAKIFHSDFNEMSVTDGDGVTSNHFSWICSQSHNTRPYRIGSVMFTLYQKVPFTVGINTINNGVKYRTICRKIIVNAYNYQNNAENQVHDTKYVTEIPWDHQQFNNP